MIFAAEGALANVALVASVAAVIVPAAWWVVRRVRVSIETQLKEQTDARIVADKIIDLEGTLNKLDVALRSHMSAEDRTNATIEGLGKELISKLTSLETGIKGNQVHMMKALMAADPIPTQLWEVVKGGGYELLWANRAYLNLTGLTLSEARSGGVWLTIHENERAMVKAGAELGGQEGGDYTAEFTMVDPHTQELIGPMVLEGHYIQGSDHHYFYLSTLSRKEDLETFTDYGASRMLT